MNSGAATRHPAPVALIGGAAGAVAFGVGFLLTVRPALAAAVVGAGSFIPLAMISVPAGFAVWIVALFVTTIPGLATSWMLAVLGAAWLGAVIRARPRISDVLRGQRVLVGALGGLLVWLSLSLLWAKDPRMTWAELRPWFTAVAVVILIATGVGSPRSLRWVLAAFVLGALVSVGIGLVGAGPRLPAPTGYPGPPSTRFTGAEGNPNDLAAHLLPAMVLGIGLAADCTRRAARAVTIAAIIVLAVAFAATQSRGGVVAAALVVPAGLVVYQRQRRQVTIVIALALTVAGVSLVLNPNALHRVTSFSDGGSGRSTLWLVAWRISQDYAPEGVGLNNFRAVAPAYVRRPGALGYVEQIDSPHIVHNTYLQLLAETGIIGLGLFLAVALVCLSAARRAACAFGRLGRSDLVGLSRAALLAGVAALAAELSDTTLEDMRFWAVLALGPALLTVASRQLAQAGEGAGSSSG